MEQTTAVLLVILALGVFGKNPLVILSTAFILILKAFPVPFVFVFLEKHGVTIGLTFLTLAVLAPIASGHVILNNLVATLNNRLGISALIGGIIAAWVSARGVELLQIRPQVIVGLIVGSILGASFFRGIPVGPLFAAGITAVFVEIAHFIR